MTKQEFGEKIKQKYPQYKNIDSVELADKMIAKYPQYKAQISETEKQPEKKEENFFKQELTGGAEIKESSGFIGGLKNFGKEVFQNTLGSKGVAGAIGNAAEIFSGAQGKALKEQTALYESNQGLADSTQRLLKAAREQTDPVKKEMLIAQAKSNMDTSGMATETGAQLDKRIVTPREQLRATLNTAILGFAGSGNIVKAGMMNVAKKLPVGSKAATTIYKAATAGKSLIPRVAESAALGAGAQTAYNIGESKPLTQGVGTAAAFGAALPVLGNAATRGKEAINSARLGASEKLINSLIKPLLKDFSYGKNPGRGVAREGLTFNTLEEGASKISGRLNSIGQRIDAAINNKADVVKDITGVFSPIDEAIEIASRTPRTNQAIIARLRDAKDDLMGIVRDPDGAVVYQKDFSAASLREIVNLKLLVGDITRFTGNASDDKAVNAALKRVYGKTKEIINKEVPELVTLNERWADLKSAEIAIKYRDKIQQRQNIIGFAPKISGLLFGASGVATLNPALIGAAVLSYGVDTLFSSSAFKTRFAKWLAKASTEDRNTALRAAPILGVMINRIMGERNRGGSPVNIKVVQDVFDGYSKIKEFFQKERYLLLPEGKTKTPYIYSEQINLPQRSQSSVDKGEIERIQGQIFDRKNKDLKSVSEKIAMLNDPDKIFDALKIYGLPEDDARILSYELSVVKEKEIVEEAIVSHKEIADIYRKAAKQEELEKSVYDQEKKKADKEFASEYKGFSSSEEEERYQAIRNLRIPTNKLSEIEDSEQFKKYVSSRLGFEKTDSILYSADKTEDELFRIIRERLINERANPIPKTYKKDIPKTDAGKTAIIDDMDNALIQEAKKYKSAEEFVKAQGQTVYRGVSEKGGTGFSAYGKGLYVTDTEGIAKSYAGKRGVIEKLNIIDANLLNADKYKIEGDIKDFFIKQYTERGFQKKMAVDKLNELLRFARENSSRIENYRGELEYISKQIGLTDETTEQLAKIVKGKGFDGIKYKSAKEIEGHDGFNYVLFNINKTKTKSQLEEIWKKANSSSKN